jgi:hypothetical protein
MSDNLTNVAILIGDDYTHLVRGLLVVPDLVMVPDAPESLTMADAEFGVAIAPGSDSTGRSAHHPRARELTVVKDATERGTVAVAFIGLADKSPHPVWRGPISRSLLERALTETGSLWKALDRVNAIPPAFHTQPMTGEYFAESPAAATIAGRPPLVRQEMSLRKGRCGIVCRICIITHICN